jgi:hypothetical protein
MIRKNTYIEKAGPVEIIDFIPDAILDDYIRKPVRIDELAVALRLFQRDDEV